MEEIKTAEDIRELASGFQLSRVLLSAIELKIFTILHKHLMTAEEVAEKIGADARAVDRLMNSLCGIGFLKKVHGKFYNTDLSINYLVESSPSFMGNLFHTNHLWHSWSQLTESVRIGSSNRGDQNKSEKKDWVEAFIAAMHFRGVRQGELLSFMLDFKNVKKMMDVGGGSAAFSMQFVKRNPSMQVTLLDLPHVIPLTKKYVEKEGLEGNFSYLEGDYLTADFGSGYDLIFLSAIIHINSYEQNKNLVQKCVDALSENGTIVISDLVMSEDRVQPIRGAFFALNMLVGTECGDTYTEKEITEWFLSAGISNVERKNTSFGSDLMIGSKQP